VIVCEQKFPIIEHPRYTAVTQALFSAVAKLRNATDCCFMSVRMEQLVSTGRIFIKYDI